MMKGFLSFCLLVSGLWLFSSCITEDMPDNSRKGNFDALWKIMDEHYCFFEEKKQLYGVDWDTLYTRYRPKIKNDMSNLKLFEVCADMLAELRDGHVNLIAAHDMARYWNWQEDYPLNRSDSLERIYLGKDYFVTCGMRYKRLADNKVGYLRCASFDSGIGSGNLNEIMRCFTLCKGLIVDLRGNGGGLVSSAQKLASAFMTEKTLVGYMSHKTGREHNDFSKPEPVYINPLKGIRWKKPVVVLTNRECYSAANNFVMYMKVLPQVIQMGDRTGGGSGLPFSSELPNGWSVRFSACPMYDKDMNSTEAGIEPDVKVELKSEDYNRGTDTLIETAIALILKENADVN